MNSYWEIAFESHYFCILQELCSHHGVVLKSPRSYDSFGTLSLMQYVSSSFDVCEVMA